MDSRNWKNNGVDQNLENRGNQKRRSIRENCEKWKSLELKMENLKLEIPQLRSRFRDLDDGFGDLPRNPEKFYDEQSRHISRTESVSSGYCSPRSSTDDSRRGSNTTENSNSNFAPKLPMTNVEWGKQPKGMDNPRNYRKVKRPSTTQDDNSDDGPSEPLNKNFWEKYLTHISAREVQKRERDILLPKIEKVPEDLNEIGDENYKPRPKFVKNDVFETEEELIMYEKQLEVALYYHEFREFYPATVPRTAKFDSAPSGTEATVLLDNYTHYNSCQFQAMCTIWKLRPLLQDPYIPTDPAHQIPTIATVPPGITVAWYQVTRIEKRSNGEHAAYLASACHLNLGHKLNTVALFRSSRILDYCSSILGGLILGDLLLVHELRRTGFGAEDQKVQEASRAYWQIAKFQVFRREIQNFETLIFLPGNESKLMDVETGKIVEKDPKFFENVKKFSNSQDLLEKFLSVEMIYPTASGISRICNGANLHGREIQICRFKPTIRVLKETKILAGNLKFSRKNFETIVMAACNALRSFEASEAPPTFSSSAPKQAGHVLERGFYTDLAPDSNGKRIIEAMFGGEKIQAPPTLKNSYCQMLQKCPMTITFDFDSIISAAIQIAHSKPEQCQILLISTEQCTIFDLEVFKSHGIQATKIEESLLSNTQILICTMDTVGLILQFGITVTTIQILNGYQFPEADFIWIFSKFPYANFGIFPGNRVSNFQNSNLAPIFRKIAIGDFVGRVSAEQICPVFW